MTSASRVLATVFVVIAVCTYHVHATHSHVECFPNNTVTLTNPFPDTLVHGVAIDSANTCNLTFSDNHTLVTMTGCSKDENIVVQLTEVEHLNGVVGGAGKVLVNIMCQEIDEGIERNIMQGLTAK
ncbi:uncharacterized protein LOC128546468 [Mercenaria mercenaria]|uniref:uncharacterized protein LOC128546468 n=1 Tax=Mercenaria mercenaria TaxID=6596 RepID=UPI00234E81FC|nr:uncharacterized protein LOC128546468 [Mercenaria mercenaria]